MNVYRLKIFSTIITLCIFASVPAFSQDLPELPPPDENELPPPDSAPDSSTGSKTGSQSEVSTELPAESSAESSNKDESKRSRSNSSSESDVESLFNSEAKPESNNNEEKQKSEAVIKRRPIDDIKSISGLKQLEPFNDVAILQKKYLSKTHRFELFGGPTLTLNDPFFMNWGVNARVGFAFTEAWSVEFNYIKLSTSQRGVTKDLLKRGVQTVALVIPKSYMGGNVRWAPIYGKFSLNDKKIVHFDMYFSLGGGLTETNQKESPATLQLGTGQIFAINRDFALRWDLSWNLYQSTSAVNNKKDYVDNVYATIGLSWFFPGARNR